MKAIDIYGAGIVYMLHSPQRNLLKLLTDLSGRLADVEERLAALESESIEDAASYDCPQEYEELLTIPATQSSSLPMTPSKRGRPPRTSAENRAQLRDQLVTFLEVRWPELEKGFRRRSSLTALLHTLVDASPGADDMPAFRHLKSDMRHLWDFLPSGRYSGEPRQIAYAMAGAPEITWRSSLDYCTKHPSAQPIHIRAHAAHIQHRRPKLYASLFKNGITPGNLGRLKSCCADCKRLAKTANRVSYALDVDRGSRQ